MSWSGTDTASLRSPDVKPKEFSPDDIVDDFIDSYVKFYSGLNAVVPDEYIELCAMFAISSVVGGRLVVRELDVGIKKINIYVVLLGPSSFSHKTIPISNLVSFLKDSGLVDFLASRFTLEAFYMEVSANPYGVIIRDEFTGILLESGKNYMSDTKETLMQAYDNNLGVRSTMKHGSIDASNSCISFLSATVPDLLSSVLVPKDVHGGYFPRHIVMFPEVKKHGGVGMSRYTKKDLSVKFKLLKTLEYIDSKFIHGTVCDARFDDAGYAVFNSWIMRNNVDADKASIDIQPFLIRMGEHLIKLCMIFQVSKTSTRVNIGADGKIIDRFIIIDEDTVRRAVVWMDKYKTFYLPRALSVLSNTEVERIFNIIKDLSSKSGGEEAIYSEVLRASKLFTNELMKIMQTLEDSDRIEMRKTLRKGSGGRKPALYIKITDVRQK